MLKLSVGLPLFNAKNIAWLALESLCRQEKIDFEWELLIIEEQDVNKFGSAAVQEYAKRLKEINCKSIKYSGIKKWMPLAKKWQFLGKQANSEYFIIQAADCYSPSLRLKETHDIFESDKEIDWIQTKQGHFYNILTKKMALFNWEHPRYHHKCALNMATRTKYMSPLPEENIRINVDSWLYRNISNYIQNNKKRDIKVHFNASQNAASGLDTHGRNCLSKGRTKMIAQLIPPFEKANKTIQEILPKDILKRIM